MKFPVVVSFVLLGLVVVQADEKDNKEKRGLHDLGYGQNFDAYGSHGLDQQIFSQGSYGSYGSYDSYGHEYEKPKQTRVETYLRQEFQVPIPHHYPVHVVKKVLVPYPVAVKVPVEHPVPVPVSKPVPYPVEKPLPYPVEKTVPVPVNIPVHIPYPVKVAIPVEKPYPVPVPKSIPYLVRQPFYVEKKVPVFFKEPQYQGGYGGADAGFGGFEGGYSDQYGQEYQGHY